MATGVQRFEHRAMATDWVITLPGASAGADWLAEQAFLLIDRVEADLSRFQATSYIRQIGRLRAGERLRVSRVTYECLMLARAVWEATGGAFDITVRLEEGAVWRSQMEALRFCESGIIEVREEGVMLDVGGVGKGFAMDEVSQFFQEEEVESGFLDAGGSTLYAIGRAPGEEEGWPASLGERHGSIVLTDQALSASGFEVQGAHLVDPRTGRRLETDRSRAWVMAGSAAVADALSTAALVMSEEEIAAFSEAHPDISIMLA